MRSGASGTRLRNSSKARGEGNGPCQRSSVWVTEIVGCWSSRSFRLARGLFLARFELRTFAIDHPLHISPDPSGIAAQGLHHRTMRIARGVAGRPDRRESAEAGYEAAAKPKPLTR